MRIVAMIDAIPGYRVRIDASRNPDAAFRPAPDGVLPRMRRIRALIGLSSKTPSRKKTLRLRRSNFSFF